MLTSNQSDLIWKGWFETRGWVFDKSQLGILVKNRKFAQTLRGEFNGHKKCQRLELIFIPRSYSG